jgi:predicted nucleic acid-binding protein
MQRVVIADAGPLIALARIGHLALLSQLFGSVSVTAWVADEVLSGGDFPDSAALRSAFKEPWLQTIDIPSQDADAWQAQCQALIHLHQIDMGEASALVLAHTLADRGDAALLLMDDYRGRQAALHGSVATMGTAGVLMLAKQVGAISTVRPLLVSLRNSGYFLSDRLVESVLAQSGE